MKSIRLKIEGLWNEETKGRVRNQLQGVKGVQDVSISEEGEHVDVIYDEQTSDNEINNHLQNNGYKVKI